MMRLEVPATALRPGDIVEADAIAGWEHAVEVCSCPAAYGHSPTHGALVVVLGATEMRKAVRVVLAADLVVRITRK